MTQVQAISTAGEFLERGLRASPALMAEVDAYARRHGVRLAEAVSYLLQAGLAAESEAMFEYDCERANAAPPARAASPQTGRAVLALISSRTA